MALAHVESAGMAPGWVEVIADTGTNAFYEYQIGDSDGPMEGPNAISRADFVSPLARHEGNAFDTRIRLRVPLSGLPPTARYLQVVSFRDEKRNGPAWSNLLRLRAAAAGPRIDDDFADLGASVRPSTVAMPSVSGNGVSHGQGFAALAPKLLDTLRAVVPAALDALGAGQVGGNALPKLLDLVAEIAKQQASKPPMLPTLASPIQKPVEDSAPKTINAQAGNQPSPAPENVSETFSRRIAVSRDRSRVARWSERAQQLARPAKSAGSPRTSVNWLPVASLAFDRGTALEGVASDRLIVSASGFSLVAQIVNAGPSPDDSIPRAIAAIRFLDASGRTILTKEVRLADLEEGAPLKLPVATNESGTMPRGSLLRADVSIRWPARNGSLAGVSGSQHFVVVDRLFAGVLDEGGRRLAVDDASRYRAFWHKVWEGGVPPESDAYRWELDAQLRYEMRPDFVQSNNSRGETRMAFDPSASTEVTHSIAGRMKSGLRLSVPALAQLANDSSTRPGLQREDLDVLASSDLPRALALQATARIRMHGKKTTPGAVWVFPEMEMRRLRMFAVDRFDDLGRVASYTDKSVVLPVPSALHVVSCLARTDDDSGSGDGTTGLHIEGYDVLEDQRIALTPLSPETNPGGA